MTYRPAPENTTDERIAALVAAIGPDLDEEIAASLVDEDEVAYPGRWQEIGFDRGAAISEYLYEIETYNQRS